MKHMKNWSTNYGGSYHRSVSSAGFNDMAYPKYESSDPAPLHPDSRFANNYCMSYVDINKAGDAPSDSRQQFSWRSPSITHEIQSNKSQSIRPTIQRPFESAFKSAICKMKESSVNRLQSCDKRNERYRSEQSKFDDVYERNCRTLQSKTTESVPKSPKLSHKIFRCNSTADRIKCDDSSVKTLSIDCSSETESDLNDRESKYQSDSTIFSNQSQNQEISHSNKSSNIQTQNVTTNGLASFSGSRIIVPASSKSDSQETRKKSRVISKAYISPKSMEYSKFATPKTDQRSNNSCEVVEIEPLQSVQEIIAKVEALTFQSDNSKVSKSHTHDQSKMMTTKPQRSTGQKYLNGYPEPQQSENSSASDRHISGIYKKSNQAPSKKKSSNNLPFDFKKLHSAFLEQKQEIKNLKILLEEKKTSIIQLESELRAYEPWR